MVDQQIARNGERAASDGELVDLELNLLLEAISRFTGHDFRDYSQGMLRRRLAERLRIEGLSTISGLQERVLHHPEAMANLILAMSGGIGHVFGDAGFFRTFRIQVVPLLRTYGFARIWAPHCARGEDVYSLAAVLHEEGLLERTMIYATDPSDAALDSARTATFPIDSTDRVWEAYRESGGTGALGELSEVRDSFICFDAERLGRSIILARHSLVSDGPLNEFHVIVARGILPQFNRTLQFRVHGLILESLVRLGFLCLGQRETLRATPYERVFHQLSGDEAIFRRLR